MPRSEGELAGRAFELARFDHAGGRAARGGVVVELVGDPGIGKSALLGVLTERVRSDGGLVLVGRGAECERTSPYALFGDALGLPSAGPTTFRDPHAVVAALLGRLAAGRPALLALDDLHWADRASVETLEHLLRAPPRAPVLLVLARRLLPRQERLPPPPAAGS